MLSHFDSFLDNFSYSIVFILAFFKTLPCSKSVFTYFILRFMLFLYAVTDVQFYFKQPFDTCWFYYENFF